MWILAYVAGTALGVGGWIWAWRWHWLPRTQRLEANNARLRQHNEEQAMELLDLREAQRRAETAEGIARGQAKHIEALQRSSDKMLEAITDMRRIGFSLPSDILHEPTDPDAITTVDDDDLQALRSYPHLAASDED